MVYEGGDLERASSVLEGYVSWQHPYQNIQIYVHPQVVRTLSDHAINSAKQGSEIGGVLWGKAGPEDSLIITDASLVHSTGPFFNATSADARNLQQVLSGRAPKATLTLAGYFRSTIREGLALTPQDQALIRQNVRDPDAVFLVIKPGSKGVCTAGLTFWDDGRLQKDASYAEIPFIPSDEPSRPDPVTPSENGTPKHEEEPSIVAILRESALRNSPPQNPSTPNYDSKPIVPEPANKRPSTSFILLGLTATSLIAAMAAITVYFSLPLLRARPHPAPIQAPKPGLNLQVQHAAGGQLSLNWNRSAPEVLGSSSAVLTIKDGWRTNKLNLDNAQLRSGKLMYFPKGDNVQFRLELNTDSLHTVAESVRVLSADGDAGHHRRGRSGAAFAPEQTDISQFPISRFEVDVPVPMPAKSESGPVPLLLPSPVLPPLVTATTWSSTPPTPSSSYVPPRVVEEMMPETTPVGQFARISVQVSIDRDGYVTAARALKDDATINATLATIATAAARRWRFEPATLNGKPVPAEYRIVFAFHRQTPQ